MSQENGRFTDEPLSIDAGGGGSIDDFDESILRKKESFCFCCCDYRRAVIVIDILAVINASMSFFSVENTVLYMVAAGFPDAGVDRALVVFADLVTLALYAGGLYGAVRYVQVGVIMGGTAHFFSLLYIGFSLFSVLFFGDKLRQFAGSVDNDAIYDAIDDDEVAKAAAEAIPGAIAAGMAIGFLCTAVLTSFYLHAHVKLLRLMKEGVMTPQNYPNVAKCCCDP